MVYSKAQIESPSKSRHRSTSATTHLPRSPIQGIHVLVITPEVHGAVGPNGGRAVDDEGCGERPLRTREERVRE